MNGDTVIYTGASRGTKAVKIARQGDGFTTTDLWSNPDLGVQFNSPVLKDGLIYGLSDKGIFFCLDATTGKTAWTDTTQRDRSGFTAMLNAGSVILALPSSSELIAFTPTDKGYTELAKIKVADTPTYAYPVVTGKNIREEQSLTLWSIQ